VLKEECESLNREWLFAHRNHRPFITVKMATSLDGKFYSAEGQSKWITSENSRNYAHQLRARVDAILTSSTTIEKDNPSFTVRENGIESPTQPSLFVLSRRKNFALNDFKVFSRIGGAQILESADLNESAKTLFENGHYDLMLEAGPKLISEFFELSLVDEVWHFVNTSYLGGSQSCLKALNQGRLLGKSFKIVKMETFDDSNFLMILSPL
jgi:diaminohydroxyphosphoribosylaminopyrimidine deaminase/5-amino-6-(5-phosphoribosylamino)uracil reductase